MEGDWIIVIPCGKESIDFIKFAQDQGFNVLGVDQNINAIALDNCNDKIICHLNNIEVIFNRLNKKNISPKYAFPIASDRAVFPCYLINRSFADIQKQPYFISYYSKIAFREFMKSEKFSNPLFLKLDEESNSIMQNFKFPLIVKPDDSAGSRGISVLNKHDNKLLEDAITEAKNYSNSGQVILEEYIVGEEYLLEGFVVDSEVIAAVIFNKLKVEDKVSYQLNVQHPSCFDYDPVIVFFNKVFRAIKYPFGAIHIEFKVKDDGIYILDFATRGGGFGLSSIFLEMVSGFNSKKAFLDCAIGLQTDEKVDFLKYGIIYFIPISKTGIVEKIIIECPLITDDYLIDIFVEIGDKVVHSILDAARLAAIYIVAEDEKRLLEIERYLKKNIKISVK